MTNVDPTINKTVLIASVSIFNEGMAKLDGHSFERCWNEIKRKFWPMYKVTTIFIYVQYYT